MGGRALLDLPARSLLQTMLVAGCGAVFLSAGLPHLGPQGRFVPANQVTWLRAVMFALLTGAIGAAPDGRVVWVATIVAAAAALLDAVDGWLARRLGAETAYGARFDMETDALLVLVLSVLVLQGGKAGPWILVSGLLRYAFVLAGILTPRFRRPLPPSLRRKAIAALQMVLLISALSPLLQRPYSDGVAVLAVMTLAVSFAIDLRLLWRP